MRNKQKQREGSIPKSAPTHIPNSDSLPSHKMKISFYSRSQKIERGIPVSVMSEQEKIPDRYFPRRDYLHRYGDAPLYFRLPQEKIIIPNTSPGTLRRS